MNAILISSLAVSTCVAVFVLAGCTLNAAPQRISLTEASADYICPLTGEVLPCPECCPLNQEQVDEKAVAVAEAADRQGYICPLTGELLPCPDCCPLNHE